MNQQTIKQFLKTTIDHIMEDEKMEPVRDLSVYRNEASDSYTVRVMFADGQVRSAQIENIFHQNQPFLSHDKCKELVEWMKEAVYNKAFDEQIEEVLSEEEDGQI